MKSQAEQVSEGLASAEAKLATNDPLAALQALTDALRAAGGEQLAHIVVQRVQEALQMGQPPEQVAAQQLANLMSSMSLESRPGKRHHNEISASMSGELPEAAARGQQMDTSGLHVEGGILADSGRGQIAADAAVDGSSFLCHRCGGLVARARKDAHEALWCTPNHASSADSLDHAAKTARTAPT